MRAEGRAWSWNLYDLDLPIRAHYWLVRHGITTPEQVAALGPAELDHLGPGLGVTYIGAILDGLCRLYGHEPRDGGGPYRVNPSPRARR